MTLTAESARGLVFGVLMLHGLGHVGAIGALVTRAFGYVAQADNGGWLAPRSWIFPTLAGTTGATVATALWAISCIGFVAAALTFWGIAFPGGPWSGIAVVSAIVSLSGIVVFFGTWPMFNTIAALAVNVAVLATQLWLRWPAQSAAGTS